MRSTVFAPRKEVTQVIIPLICSCGLMLASSGASAMQTANTEATLGVTLSAEQDDNIDLVNDADKEEDLTFHVIPAFDMTHFFNDHNLNLLLNGDYRQGADMVDGEINLEAGVGMDLNFTGGLQIALSDTFEKEQFDQHLYTEIGVSDSQRNTYRLQSSYSFGERTSVEAAYSHLWEEYDDQPEKTVYDTDTVNGRLTIPVTRRWKSYLAAELSSVDSDRATSRNQEDVEGVLGFLWEGPNRFSCWLEGGLGEIDYDDAGEEDFSEAIGETGIEVKLTPWTSLQASVGTNSYGSLKYNGGFRHNFYDKLELTLQASRNRLRSYTLQSITDTYDVTLFKLALKSTLLERIEAGLTASYQILDQVDSLETLIGKATLDYPIQDWLKAGAHYQYATRAADKAEEEYNDNRIGFFVTFSL
ncbi:MAG: hypothetical protein WGN25_20010 [Candidatus Electrothrix sp. GW3-4]|uniref:hypothetical protein n=1 Tax=Candidatus Electrothrix sp. GW3-4 TaxID=3126740 RepID=UPI0030CD22CB